MKCSVIRFFTLVSVLSALTNAVALEKSPFADKPCDSYSNYTDDNGKPGILLWGDAPLTDFGSREVKFITNGIRKLNEPPKPGVHPRIIFTPDDLPDIRKRLKETRCGQEAWKNLLCWTEMMKGVYDDQADYAKPDVWKGSFGGLRGRVPLFRLNAPMEPGKPHYNKNAKAAELYKSLAAGTATDFHAFYWNVFALEAFRCLIEEDKSGAETLAKAVITALKIGQGKREAERKAKSETKPPSGPIGSFQLSFTYDFIYNWMTAEQRKAIHDELAATTWSHDNYGTFNEATTSRSNWATFSYWLFQVMGIEGEEGFNELKVRGMYRGWRNMLTYGWFQSGATYEGEAKQQLGMDGIIIFAMRGKQYGFENLCGHPSLQAYARNFIPLSINPMQTGFNKYDLLGGSRASTPMFQVCDILGLKYMFPGDRLIDWAYRKSVGEDYEKVPDRPDGYFNGLLFYAIFASDFDKSNDELAALKLGNTFFCGERALMMTRSGWDKDAMMLNMHTRQANGGHPFSDRNSIMVAGAGRIWSPNGHASFRTCENSTVCIDGRNQDEVTPGRMLDFMDMQDATFAVGDSKYCWDWTWKWLNRKQGYYTLEDVRSGKVEIPRLCEPVIHGINDFAYTKLPYDYLNRPMFESPSWILPKGALTPVVRQPNFPVKKAFRTAGLIRGARPYSLVVDDIQKDDTVHHYDWTLALEYDIQIAKFAQNSDGTMDIVLTGDDPNQDKKRPKDPLPSSMSADAKIPAGQPMLLVKVLNRNQDKLKPAQDPDIVEVPNIANPQKNGKIRRLVIPSDSIAPDFKVIIYAYRQGEPLPVISWNREHTAATVKIGDQTDTISFTATASGKTDLSVSRNGSKSIINVNRTVLPLKDAAVEKREMEEAKIKDWVKKELSGFKPERLDGVVAYWNFENLKDGVVVNAADPKLNIPVGSSELVPGRVGQALKFNETEKGINLPMDVSQFAAQGFTIAFWVQDPEKKGGFFFTNNGQRGLGLGIENQNLRCDSNGQWRCQSTPCEFENWHHVAWTNDGKVLNLYIDGKEVSAKNIETPPSFSKTSYIAVKYDGLMDELIICRRALSADDILKIYYVQTYASATVK